MDLQTAKNAVRTARLVWHDTIVGKDVDKEFDAIDKLDRVIESLQIWLPEYDPRARHLWSRSVVDDCTRLLNIQIHILSCLEQPT